MFISVNPIKVSDLVIIMVWHCHCYLAGSTTIVFLYMVIDGDTYYAIKKYLLVQNIQPVV